MNKKKYRDMEYSVKKCVAWLGYAFLAAGLSTSCDMMHDETDDCPTGLYLSFKYDYNLQRADMFNDHVGAVSVYVFDETVAHASTMSNPKLKSSGTLTV